MSGRRKTSTAKSTGPAHRPRRKVPDAAPKRKPGRRPGEWVTGATESQVLVTGPAVLLGAVEVAAEREGVSVREWWRRAARLRLGWREVPEEPPSELPRD